MSDTHASPDAHAATPKKEPPSTGPASAPRTVPPIVTLAIVVIIVLLITAFATSMCHKKAPEETANTATATTTAEGTESYTIVKIGDFSLKPGEKSQWFTLPDGATCIGAKHLYPDPGYEKIMTDRYNTDTGDQLFSNVPIMEGNAHHNMRKVRYINTLTVPVTGEVDAWYPKGAAPSTAPATTTAADDAPAPKTKHQRDTPPPPQQSSSAPTSEKDETEEYPGTTSQATSDASPAKAQLTEGGVAQDGTYVAHVIIDDLDDLHQFKQDRKLYLRLDDNRVINAWVNSNTRVRWPNGEWYLVDNFRGGEQVKVVVQGGGVVTAAVLSRS